MSAIQFTFKTDQAPNGYWRATCLEFTCAVVDYTNRAHTENLHERQLNISFDPLTLSKEEVKIRLYGIDCPESKQAFGTVAKKFTGDAVFGKEVTVKDFNKDRYGRTVAMIYYDGGKCLNYEIVEEGLGWCYHQYNKAPQIEELEGKARALKVGLWVDPAPISPWEFRKKPITLTK